MSTTIEASQTGVAAKSTVGQWFSRALAENPSEKEAYEAIGKSYSAQREFRKRWAERAFKASVTQRLHTQSYQENDDVSGT